jgi:hypothetical protein
MIDLVKCVFVVDGRTEIRSFKAKLRKEYQCEPDFLKHPGGGGDYNAQAYANAVRGLIEVALRGVYTRILCITDRERRPLTAVNYASLIRTAIIDLVELSTHHSRAELKQKISVCVPDQMFENWIIADVDGIKQCADLVKDAVEQEYFDGKNGKAILQQLMKVRYRNVQHAPVLFKQVTFQRAACNSSSFCRFLQELQITN